MLLNYYYYLLLLIIVVFFASFQLDFAPKFRNPFLPPFFLLQLLLSDPQISFESFTKFSKITCKIIFINWRIIYIFSINSTFEQEIFMIRRLRIYRWIYISILIFQILFRITHILYIQMRVKFEKKNVDGKFYLLFSWF